MYIYVMWYFCIYNSPKIKLYIYVFFPIFIGVSIDNPEPPVYEEGGEVNYDPNYTNSTDKSGKKLKKMMSLESGKESLKQIRQEFKDSVKEVKAEVKEQVKHLPDGHRGSIASITERPAYKQIPKSDQSKDEKQ